MEAYSSYRFSQNKVAKVGLVFVLRKRKLKHDVVNHNGQCVYFQSYGRGSEFGALMTVCACVELFRQQGLGSASSFNFDP